MQRSKIMVDEWGEPQVGGNTHDLQEEGALVGTYVGYKEVPGDFGISQLHSFDTDDGRKSVWGKTHLNRLLEGRNGELVKIALTGKMIDIPGRKPMYEYVLWSKGRPSPAPALPGDSPSASQSSATEGSPPFPEAEGPFGQDEAATLRARRIAIAMKDAGFDDETRGELINWHTFGETSSAKQLDEKQSDALYALVQKIRRGKLNLRYDSDGKLFMETSNGTRVNP
jgi:hypothetical protein